MFHARKFNNFIWQLVRIINYNTLLLQLTILKTCNFNMYVFIFHIYVFSKRLCSFHIYRIHILLKGNKLDHFQVQNAYIMCPIIKQTLKYNNLSDFINYRIINAFYSRNGIYYTICFLLLNFQYPVSNKVINECNKGNFKAS